MSTKLLHIILFALLSLVVMVDRNEAQSNRHEGRYPPTDAETIDAETIIALNEKAMPVAQAEASARQQMDDIERKYKYAILPTNHNGNG